MYCRKCSAQQPEGTRYCNKCGFSLYEADGTQNGATPVRYLEYAGFWRRFGAYIIDYVILNAVSLGIGAITNLGINTTGSTTDIDIFTYFFSANFLWYFAINFMADVLYWGLFESSPLRATPGKMVLSIKVTDIEGNRISFGRAVGRYLSKIISSLIFGIGYIMIAFTEKKQGLHDIMAGTLVIQK
jgi:uncharacterized RDD family membrane protein YckC